jgi:hypothetical protein
MSEENTDEVTFDKHKAFSDAFDRMAKTWPNASLARSYYLSIKHHALVATKDEMCDERLRSSASIRFTSSTFRDMLSAVPGKSPIDVVIADVKHARKVMRMSLPTTKQGI